MAEPVALPAAFLTTPLAHRGLHGAAWGRTENSCAAIRAACEAGYGIELDVQMSRDGEAMVFHDYTLERLTGGEGQIGKTDAADLTQTILSGTSDRIPTLGDVLEMVAGRTPLLVELKDQDGRLGTNVGQMARRVAELLAAYSGDTACMSFNPHSVAALREAAPGMALGLVTGPLEGTFWTRVPERRLAELRDIPDVARTGASFLSHRFNDLDAKAVQREKSAGLAILCWTVRSGKEERIARRVADNITFEGYLPKL